MQQLPRDIVVRRIAPYIGATGVAVLRALNHGWRDAMDAAAAWCVWRCADLRRGRAVLSPDAVQYLVIDMRTSVPAGIVPMADAAHAPFLLYGALNEGLCNARSTTGLRPSTLWLYWGALRTDIEQTDALLSLLWDHLADPRCRVADLCLRIEQQSVRPAHVATLARCCATMALRSLAVDVCDVSLQPLLAYAAVAPALHTLCLGLHIHQRLFVGPLREMFRSQEEASPCTRVLRDVTIRLHGDGVPYPFPIDLLSWLSTNAPEVHRLRIQLHGSLLWPSATTLAPVELPRLDYLCIDVSHSGLCAGDIGAFLGAFHRCRALRTLHVHAEGNDLGSTWWKHLAAALMHDDEVWARDLGELRLWLAQNPRCPPPGPTFRLSPITHVHDGLDRGSFLGVFHRCRALSLRAEDNDDVDGTAVWTM